MPAPRDTHDDAWLRQIQGFRAMRPKDRVQAALEMTEHVREIARAGVRARHPDWTLSQVEDAVAELLLGTELARTARERRIALAR